MTRLSLRLVLTACRVSKRYPVLGSVCVIGGLIGRLAQPPSKTNDANTNIDATCNRVIVSPDGRSVRERQWYSLDGVPATFETRSARLAEAPSG